MLLLSASEQGELSLVRFEGVSEERKAGWRCETGCVCLSVFVSVCMCGRENGKERDREAG